MDGKHILILLLMLATLGVLIFGVITMMRGGEANRKNSNKLMTIRVWLQGATILLLGVMFMMGKSH